MTVTEYKGSHRAEGRRFAIVAARFNDRIVDKLLEGARECLRRNGARDEDVVVTLSHEGFVKRIPIHLYRRRVGSGKALAGMERYEDDYLERIFVARMQGWILAFTEGGHCHFLRVQDVPESARASRGQSVYSLMEGADRNATLSLLNRGVNKDLSLMSPWTDWRVIVEDEEYLITGPEGRNFSADRDGKWNFVAWESPKAMLPEGRLWVSDAKGLRAYVPDKLRR